MAKTSKYKKQDGGKRDGVDSRDVLEVKPNSRNLRFPTCEADLFG